MPEISRQQWDAFQRYQEDQKKFVFSPLARSKAIASTSLFVPNQSLEIAPKPIATDSNNEILSQVIFHESGLTFPQFMAKNGQVESYKHLRVIITVLPAFDYFIIDTIVFVEQYVIREELKSLIRRETWGDGNTAEIGRVSWSHVLFHYKFLLYRNVRALISSGKQ